MRRDFLRSVRLPALAALLAVVACGCATHTSPTPLPFLSGGPLDASKMFVGRAEEGQEEETLPASVDVLYATDRQPKTNGDEVTGYSSRRGLTTRFGLATVHFGGKNATVGSIADEMARDKRPTIEITKLNELGEYWRTIPLSDPRIKQLMEMKTTTPAIDASIREPEQRFIAELKRRLTPSGHVLLYVPGFNTPFEAPVLHAAEFAFYLDGEAVPVAFSWPAWSTFLGYSKQLTSAEVSVRSLRELISLIAAQSEVKRIDLLSFSAGAPMASDALLQLRLMHHELSAEEVHKVLKIGRVIYAGSDEDMDRFRNMYLDGFGDVAEHITLYSSSSDWGLLLSEWFVRGSKRLGRLAGNLSESERSLLSAAGNKTDVIDVGRAQSRAGGGDIFSHAYWYGNPWVRSDVLAQLRLDLSPGQRALVRPPVSKDKPDVLEPVWEFPKDYPEAVDAAIAAHMNGE